VAGYNPIVHTIVLCSETYQQRPLNVGMGLHVQHICHEIIHALQYFPKCTQNPFEPQNCLHTLAAEIQAMYCTKKCRPDRVTACVNFAVVNVKGSDKSGCGPHEPTQAQIQQAVQWFNDLGEKRCPEQIHPGIFP
jgi:hypothetical protein